LSMRGSADTAGIPDVESRPAGFRFEIACKDQLLEMKLESTPDFSYPEMRAACGHFFDMRFGHIFPMAFLNSSFVAAFCGPNCDSRNEVCFAASRQVRTIIAPEAPHSHAAFLNIRRDASSDGERCTKDTDHPIRHPSRHPRIFGRVRNRRDCTWSNDQFGRGPSTGLGWSDPTFVHFSVPKVVRGVASAQLRGDRAAFHSREPQ
jgi:hypothetical protein